MMEEFEMREDLTYYSELEWTGTIEEAKAFCRSWGFSSAKIIVEEKLSDFSGAWIDDPQKKTFIAAWLYKFDVAALKTEGFNVRVL